MKTSYVPACAIVATRGHLVWASLAACVVEATSACANGNSQASEAYDAAPYDAGSDAARDAYDDSTLENVAEAPFGERLRAECTRSLVDVRTLCSDDADCPVREAALLDCPGVAVAPQLALPSGSAYVSITVRASERDPQGHVVVAAMPPTDDAPPPMQFAAVGGTFLRAHDDVLALWTHEASELREIILGAGSTAQGRALRVNGIPRDVVYDSAGEPHVLSTRSGNDACRLDGSDVVAKTNVCTLRADSGGVELLYLEKRADDVAVMKARVGSAPESLGVLGTPQPATTSGLWFLPRKPGTSPEEVVLTSPEGAWRWDGTHYVLQRLGPSDTVPGFPCAPQYIAYAPASCTQSTFPDRRLEDVFREVAPVTNTRGEDFALALIVDRDARCSYHGGCVESLPCQCFAKLENSDTRPRLRLQRMDGTEAPRDIVLPYLASGLRATSAKGAMVDVVLLRDEPNVSAPRAGLLWLRLDMPQ